MKRTNGIDFSDEVLEQIRSLVRQEPSISRVQLSRRVCEWLGLVNSTTGKLKEVSCRKALCELDRQQIICLPPVSKQFSFQSPRPVAPPAITPLNVALKELGPLELVRVAKGELSAVWRGMLDAYHYLKSGPLCGHQIRYLVRSPVYGWVAALSFSACSPSVENRDGWIGWNKAAKTANRHLLVNNSRFLIPPMVKVKGLASHVLALAAARLSSDWKALYGYEPAMLETYVECGRFRGSCYAGAGWKHVGTTKGIGRNRERVAPKEVYLNPLKDDWRHLLCSVNGQTQVISPKALNEDPKDWIEEEFGHAQLGDSRLTARLLQITGQFFQNPMSSISHACGSFAAATLAYRFLDNERVDWQAILRSHFDATADRIREHPLVLVAQDTTTLNYSALTKTVGLGPICENEHVRGLVVHDTLSFTPAGTPLGLLDVQVWTRPEPDGQKHPESYKSKPIEQKESFKWLASFQQVSTVQKRCAQTQIVLIADREADIYEYFVEHMKTRHPADLLVRANHNTQRKAQLEIEQEPSQQKEDPRTALL